MENILLRSDLPLPLQNRGKVRDVYALDEAGTSTHLLFIATDRISAFDCVLESGIPSKGRVLTQMSLFWFDFLRHIVPPHLVTADVSLYPKVLHPFSELLEGRSMLVERAQMIEVECVARGYLAGSGWKEYSADGTVCGIRLPGGLRDGDRLPQPIFTPAIKSHGGHDQNVPFEHVADTIGSALAEHLRELTLDIYRQAAAYALERGIILADTKFEFGHVAGQLVLADEVLTPDSSRWWPADTYLPGRPQPSFDKQYVRDYLETLPWNKQPPAPGLPADVVRRTSEKYQEAFLRLTGQSLYPDRNASL